MKKLLIAVAILLLLEGVAMADFDQHPRFSHISTLINAIVQRVSDAQALYFTQNGKYFQGIQVPSDPTDGTSNLSVNWNAAPEDQETTWKGFDGITFASNIKIPFQIKIDTYNSPQGHGWLLRIDVYYDGLGPDQFGNDGSHWMYFHHEGPMEWELQDIWFIGY